jgi:hypothetical protein
MLNQMRWGDSAIFQNLGRQQSQQWSSNPPISIKLGAGHDDMPAAYSSSNKNLLWKIHRMKNRLVTQNDRRQKEFDPLLKRPLGRKPGATWGNQSTKHWDRSLLKRSILFTRFRFSSSSACSKMSQNERWGLKVLQGSWSVETSWNMWKTGMSN